jgi:outer membrane lipoprotein-sorting protein
MASRPVLRWVLPAGIVAVVLGGGALTTALRASADVRLPPRSAAQLLVDLQNARLDGISGTVVERADLGLPGLPAGLGAGAGGGTDIASLITGTHTLRVWYSGKDKARVALLAAASESDIIMNGKDTWVWDSKSNTATHYKESPEGRHDKAPVPPAGSDVPKTPQEVADQVLKALDPTTAVSTDSNAIVAGHKAYQLVLQPKDKSSLIGEVRFAIDGDAHVPTRAEVFAKGSLDKAAFEIGFTQVSFQRPDDSVFTFNPPPGAQVKEADDGDRPGAPGMPADKQPADKEPADKSKVPADKNKVPAAEPDSVVIGKGWTAVLVTKAPTAADVQKSGAGALQGFLEKLPQVHGSFGSGRVLNSKLFTVLLLDDGRVLVGAVSEDRLIQVANDPAAALK